MLPPQGFDEEVRIWVTTARRYPSCIGFVEHVLCQLMLRPHAYLDSLMALTAKVRQHMEQRQAGAQDPASAASPAGSGSATLLSPVSPMIVAVCQHMSEAGSGPAEAVAPFVCAALGRVLRIQTEPHVLLVAALQSLADVRSAGAFCAYLQSWVALEPPSLARLLTLGPVLPDNAQTGTTWAAEPAADAKEQVHTTDTGSLCRVLQARFPPRNWGQDSAASASLFDEKVMADILLHGQGRQYQGSLLRVAQVVRTLPFEDLLDNCTRFAHLTNPAVLALLHESLDRQPPPNTASVSKQLLLCIRSIIGAVRNAGAELTGSPGWCLAANTALGGCFELLHHTLVLPGTGSSPGTSQLDETLSHPLLAREFLRTDVAVLPVSSTFNYHVANLVAKALTAQESAQDQHAAADADRGTGAGGSSGACCDALLGKMVSILNAMVTSELDATRRDIVAHQKTVIPIVSMLVKYIPLRGAVDLLDKLLDLAPEALVCPAPAGALVGAASLTHLGRLLISLLTSGPATINVRVSVPVVEKLLALSRECPCTALDQAVLTILSTTTQEHVSPSNHARLSRPWADFTLLADRAYADFLCSSPTRERGNILKILLSANPTVQTWFEAFWADGAKQRTLRPDFLASISAYLALISSGAGASGRVDDMGGLSWDALCQPFHSAASPSSTTLRCVAALFDTAVAAFADGSMSASVAADPNAALSPDVAAGAADAGGQDPCPDICDVAQRLLCVVPEASRVRKQTFCAQVFKDIVEEARRNKTLLCSQVRLCLTAASVITSGAEASGANKQLLELLHVLLLVAVEEEHVGIEIAVPAPQLDPQGEEAAPDATMPGLSRASPLIVLLYAS